MGRRGSKPRAAVEDFAGAIRAALEAGKRAGIAFEDAWRQAVSTVRPAERGWGPTHAGAELRTDGSETAFQLLHRAMKAAYHGRELERVDERDG